MIKAKVTTAGLKINLDVARSNYITSQTDENWNALKQANAEYEANLQVSPPSYALALEFQFESDYVF